MTTGRCGYQCLILTPMVAVLLLGCADNPKPQAPVVGRVEMVFSNPEGQFSSNVAVAPQQ